MKSKKTKKPIKLYEATQSDASESEVEVREKQLNKHLDQEISMLIMEVGNERQKEHKHRKIIAYPLIKFGLSDQVVNELEKTNGKVRPIELFTRIVNREFELNGEYTKDNEKLQPFIDSLKDLLVDKLKEVKNERLANVELTNAVYCRHEEDQHQLRKYEAIQSTFHRMFEDCAAKFGIKKRRASQKRKQDSEGQVKQYAKDQLILKEIQEKIMILMQRHRSQVKLTENSKRLEDLQRKITRKWRRVIRTKKENVLKVQSRVYQAIRKAETLRVSIEQLNRKLLVLQKLANKQDTLQHSTFFVNCEMPLF